MSGAVQRRVVALVSAAALCVSVPGAVLADEGGVPHNTKPCKSLPSQAKAKGPKQQPKNNKGKKCGFHRAAG
jgi:hypothetical protein